LVFRKRITLFAEQAYFSGSLDITWSGGQKYRDVDLTIVSKE
jgi:hypothetical protein